MPATTCLPARLLKAQMPPPTNPTCKTCGQVIRRSREQYHAQRRAAREERRAEILRRWDEGETLRQIADALNSSWLSISQEMSRMRREGGYKMTYRVPQERRINIARGILRTTEESPDNPEQKVA